VDARELPHFPPVEPDAARETFNVKRGFHLELVAAEPLVSSPVAACFDEAGRLFVAEMRDYSEQRDLQPHLGRIRLLEDLDNDGRCDRATIFADDLPWPTALIWARGGLYVCAAPDILRLEDTDADGHADVRQVVFTGFNTGTPRLNVQALPNSFAWGPDNRLHLQTGGGNRGLIRRVKEPQSPPVELAGRDFWFDPHTYEFGFEAGGGQYGMSYDDVGRRFVCNNSDHLRTYVFDDRYAARNPFADLPSPLASIAADGPAAEVFRISPDEPWRVVRTRWRVAGKASGPVEGGGRVSGYFTGATGTIVYRGDVFGAEFIGNTFTGDAGGNLVHRKRLRENGASVLGERPSGEEAAEFVASRDTWFRPVSFANAPDGTLYIIDMYREVIEHPWSIPEPIKSHLDLSNGRDRGRIWRLAPDGFKPRSAPALHRASNEELVGLLEHPNGWHRDTATRLLWERHDDGIVPSLVTILNSSRSSHARLHALRALDGLDALAEAILVQALNDSDAAVRECAVRLSEKLSPAGQVPPRIWKRLSTMAQDPSPRVRLQLACTIGDVKNDEAIRLLAKLATPDSDDPWISAAVRSAPPDRTAPLFRALAADPHFFRSQSGDRFLAQLALSIGARHDAEEVEAVITFCEQSPPRLTVLAALGEGLERSGQSLVTPAHEARLRRLFTGARTVLTAPKTAATDLVAAIRVLGFDTAPETNDALLKALKTQTSATAATRALFDALDRKKNDSTLAAAVLKQWHEFNPALRAEAARFLCARPARSRALVEAIRASLVTAEEIPAAEIARLRQSRDTAVAEAVPILFPVAAAESRDDVLRRFEPALQQPGQPDKGRIIYAERCASCHRFHGDGYAVGPDLESVAGGGKEKLLTHLIDPDREVAPQFAAYVAELADGVVLSGVLASESSDSITMREPLGRETKVPRARLKRMQTTGRSPMPEGLESGLSLQQMADLLAFLAGS